MRDSLPPLAAERLRAARERPAEPAGTGRTGGRTDAEALTAAMAPAATGTPGGRPAVILRSGARLPPDHGCYGTGSGRDCRCRCAQWSRTRRASSAPR